jgi:type II secretory pathway pseudopilin PulG
MKKYFIQKKKSGYTIIETMIAISLFIVIVMAGMGALLNANLLHKKSQSMRSIIDNLNFVMEDMSKNLRTGYSYYCIIGSDTLANVNTTKSGQNCWGIAFEYQDGTADPNDQWVYYIGPDTSIPDSMAIWKSTAGPYTTSSFIKLTPNEVVIDAAKSSFSIIGAEPPPESPGPDQQPFVTIKLVGSITYNNVVSPFILQTSVSQRQIDI